MISVRRGCGAGRRWWLWLRLLGIGLVLWVTMAMWAFSSPPGSAPDESSHLEAAWAVTHGQSSSDRTYEVPRQIWRTQCHGFPAVPSGMARALAPCFTPTGPVGADLVRVTNMTSLYPPGFHWLMGQFWTTDLPASVYRMRAFAALGCTLLIMVPLALLSAIGGLAALRRFGPVLLVCLSPLAFFLFGSVNPSSWDMAGAVCAWGCMVVLAHATRRVHVVVGLAGMALGVLAGALTRPSGGLMLLVGLALAAPIVLGRIAPGERRPRRWFWAVVTCAYLALGVFGVIFAAQGRLSIRWSHTGPPNVHSPLWHWLTDALGFGYYLWGSFTRLGWVDTPIPEVVGLIFTAIIGYLVIFAVRQGRAAVLASLLMVSFAAWFLTTAILATGSPPDIGLQTRYMWPLYIGIPMIAAVALGSRPARRGPDDPFAGHVRLVTGGGLIVASWIAFFTNVRRYTVGLVDFPFLSPERWQPPVLGTTTLLVTFLVAYAVLVILLNAGPVSRMLRPFGRIRPGARHFATAPAEAAPDVAASQQDFADQARTPPDQEGSAGSPQG